MALGVLEWRRLDLGTIEEFGQSRDAMRTKAGGHEDARFKHRDGSHQLARCFGESASTQWFFGLVKQDCQQCRRVDQNHFGTPNSL